MSTDGSYALIFGGCCSNVFALEAIVQHEPDSGLLITVVQLLLVTLFTLPTQFERRKPLLESKHASSSAASILPYTIRSPRLPLIRLATAAALFCAVNLLNNWAFAFKISVPMHIILRSFGSVATLTVGYCVGKRYTTVQVLGVAGLTFGVVLAAWADASAKGKDLSLTPAMEQSNLSSFWAGVAVLFIAQLLGAIQGVYTEQTYNVYGRHWQENLFYTHFLGTLFSLALLPSLVTQLRRLALGPKLSIPLVSNSSLRNVQAPQILVPFVGSLSSAVNRLFLKKQGWVTFVPSQALALLLLNAVTQYACITGVNKLSANTTAVTVTVVLNIRKLVSFLLSCVLFGNEMTPMMALGAGIVFTSGAVYGLGSAMKNKQVKKESAKAEGGEDVTRYAPEKEATTTGAQEENGTVGSGFLRVPRYETKGRANGEAYDESFTTSAVLHPDGTMSRR